MTLPDLGVVAIKLLIAGLALLVLVQTVDVFFTHYWDRRQDRKGLIRHRKTRRDARRRQSE